jgi:hypothetical protein
MVIQLFLMYSERIDLHLTLTISIFLMQYTQNMVYYQSHNKHLMGMAGTSA